MRKKRNFISIIAIKSQAINKIEIKNDSKIKINMKYNF